MAHSSLVGIDRTARPPTGHDTATLGPSDSSDSGSDVAGLVDLDNGDPGMPVDVATEPDRMRSETSAETLLPGVDTDAAGTGERRSAGSDAGRREAADITPDNVVSVTDISGSSEEPELELTDAIDEVAAAPDSEPDEDEDADPVGEPADGA